MTALLPGTGQSLADLAAASLTPAEAKQRETLLRQVLPLWGRVLPDATIAVVVALTAEIAADHFKSAVLGFARTEERLSWDNPIPMLLAADRRMLAAAAAERDKAARAAHDAQAVPMPDEVRANLERKFGTRFTAAREGNPEAMAAPLVRDLPPPPDDNAKRLKSLRGLATVLGGNQESASDAARKASNGKDLGGGK